MQIKRAATGLMVALAVTSGVLSATQSGTTTRTGSIDVTWSKGQCASAFFCVDLTGNLDLDVVRVHVDCHATCDTNALALTNATGRIGRIDILAEGEDAIKIRGAHDLTIQGGTATADARYSTSHQDCVQSFGANNVLVQNVVFSCKSANNAQWYMDGLSASSIPTNVICDRCTFLPAATANHVVELALSDSSGVTNSLICPGARQALVFDVRSTAVRPVDVGNTKPWPASDPRCTGGVTVPPPSVTTVTTTAAATTTTPASTTSATTTAQTTTTSAPLTASELIADGFVILRGQALQYANWKTANPVEAAKLEAYLASCDTPPALVTATGRADVLFAEAGCLP